MKLITAILFLILSTLSMATDGIAGPYKVSLRTDPRILPVGRAQLILTLTDKSGQPVTDATVRVFAQMPGMPMGEREVTAKAESAPGTYSARTVFGMAGAYDAKITIVSKLGAAQTTIKLATGERSDEATGSNTTLILIIGAALIALIVVVRLVRSSGQHFNARSIFNRQVGGALIILGVALGISIWAINTKRRPGAMTPLEAQIMEMNAPAPEGSLPVEVAKIERRAFSSSVTFSGQAVGFVEQDVVSRAAGVIVSMPFYVGNKVSKGQVLARLDTSATDPMVSEKTAQTSVAAQGIDIAQSEYQRALADVTQAESEQAIREGAIDEAKAMVAAGKQAELSAEANLRMEQASVVDAQSQVTAAEADRDYWVQELNRSKQLFDKGAISRDELQKSQASSQSAAAKVRQARSAVEAANARVQGARAAISKSAAELVALMSKQREMQAEHHAHMAHVTSSRASAESARRRIRQATSELQMANAGLKGATTQRDYSELKSEVDGVVTARLISPGVVIAPGQSVLKVAQVSPIRLQANVPEADLARIHVRAKVKVKLRDGSGKPLEVAISSVAPSVDAMTRTGLVEAIYENKDHRFVPGQFLSLEISTATDDIATVAPANSLVTDEGHSYIWVAEPSTNNQFTVSKHEVKLNGLSGDWVSIASGVTSGQMVVIAPSPDLNSGSVVTLSNPMSEPTPGTEKVDQTVEITAAGYSPQSISVPAGKAFKVTFIRRDDKTCGTEVIFPDLGIRKALPLNQPVVVDIPAQPAGKELNFTCPMNMLNGKAVAK